MKVTTKEYYFDQDNQTNNKFQFIEFRIIVCPKKKKEFRIIVEVIFLMPTKLDNGEMNTIRF